MTENNHDLNEGTLQDLSQFITFTVQDQEYGVDIMSVREIKGWTDTTALPNTPIYVRGVINLRGSVVPILDLRCRFGLGFTDATKNHVVMIVNVENRIVGILVDGVSDILTVPNSDVRSIPNIDNVDNTSILKGIINLSDRMVALLVLEKLFDHTIEISDAHLAHIQMHGVLGSVLKETEPQKNENATT
ncbi:MAG: chemotaxis protein CheW [Proteobacteria bacterium]|nr:chemotaxis protein CheW [Pseudomonadota bacterium]